MGCLLHPLPDTVAHGTATVEKQQGLVEISHMDSIVDIERLGHNGHHVGQRWLYALNAPHFAAVQKHDEGWRSLDLESGGELWLGFDIDAEYLLLAIERLGDLLQKRFDCPTVSAAVRHELHRDGAGALDHGRVKAVARKSRDSV